MKKLIAGVVLGLGLSMTAYGAGDPEAGEANAGVCAGCHGQGGAAPVMAEYPKLSGLGEKYLYQQLKSIKDGERVIPEMTGLLDNRSDQDLQDLAAYFDQQEMPLNQADPELIDQGASLYRGGNLATNIAACAACHNPNGLGNEPAAYPRLGGQNAEYVAKSLRDYRAGERDGPNAQIMTDIAARLTDAEIEAVANYISGLH
ncbi:Cytochrome c553 [Marinobacter daqiaonensis]|uniref:Cytochrome c553 n=1 Tax=Marinobacter daqiaonensis TaxID=650891 RepID=A0A1I6JS18_9GAMM|nr:c-type cytochrome [Marinobacter daqiaonensis]SFR81752.1 Cytochrome c553 [Marinobacter daqiaonensis]